MLRELSSEQFAGWWAFYRRQPWGFYADNLRAGVVASTVANCNRRKGQPPFRASDFLPTDRGESEPERPADNRAIAAQGLALFEGLAARGGVADVERAG